MKPIKFSICFALTFLTQVALADCKQSVEAAVFALVRPQGNDPDSSVFATINDSVLTGQSGKSLNYLVRVDYEINDGSSTGYFPAELYSVQARGSHSSCKVISVALKK